MNETIQDKIQIVTAIARELTEPTSEVAQSEQFIEAVSVYLIELGDLNTALGALDDLEVLSQDERDELGQLFELHTTIVQQAMEAKEAVATEMVDLQKRTQAFRAYIDRFPKRISVVGKREG